MFPQQYSNMQGGMSQQYSNYGANTQSTMQGNQQMMQGSQANIFAGQQQGMILLTLNYIKFHISWS